MGPEQSLDPYDATPLAPLETSCKKDGPNLPKVTNFFEIQDRH